MIFFRLNRIFLDYSMLLIILLIIINDLINDNYKRWLIMKPVASKLTNKPTTCWLIYTQEDIKG